MWTEIIITVFTILAYIFYVTRRPKNYPPGRFSWPLVGNLLQMGTEPYKNLMKMRAKYGDIISLDIGSQKAIVFHDIKVIKEVMNMNVFSGRIEARFQFHPDSGKRRGVIMSEGSQWNEQRRFMLRNLRDFGFGKKSMESLIQDEVSEIIETFQKQCGTPITTQATFNVAVVNAIWTITSGERFKHDDPKIKELIGHLIQFTSLNLTLLVAFPWIGKFAPRLSGHNKAMAKLVPIFDFMQKSIDEHKKTFQEGVKRDLIDCYLDAINNAPDSSSFAGKDGDENMLMGTFDLFLAGAESTSTSLNWTVYLLSHFPKSQERLNKVISETVGTTRLPALADRANMPYAEAVILEALRYSAMVPFGAGRAALEDVEFMGYKIPKGTLIISNQYGVLHDPETWGDPENFRPERFLSEDGNSVIRYEAHIPFSTGKRVCIGESLAKDELFLFTTALFQRFRVEFDPNSPKPELGHSTQTSFLLPKPHKVVFHDLYQ